MDYSMSDKYVIGVISDLFSKYHGLNIFLFIFIKTDTEKIIESFCCKKSPNQEIGLRRFSEYRTSEGSE